MSNTPSSKVIDTQINTHTEEELFALLKQQTINLGLMIEKYQYVMNYIIKQQPY